MGKKVDGEAEFELEDYESDEEKGGNKEENGLSKETLEMLKKYGLPSIF